MCFRLVVIAASEPQSVVAKIRLRVKPAMTITAETRQLHSSHSKLQTMFPEEIKCQKKNSISTLIFLIL